MSPLSVHDKKARPTGSRYLPGGWQLSGTGGPCWTTGQGSRGQARAREPRHVSWALGTLAWHGSHYPLPGEEVVEGESVAAAAFCLEMDGEGGREQRWLGSRGRERVWVHGDCLRWSQVSSHSAAPSKSNLPNIPVRRETSSPISMPGEQPQQLSLTAKSLSGAQAALPHQLPSHHGAVPGPGFVTVDEQSTQSGLSTEARFSWLWHRSGLAPELLRGCQGASLRAASWVTFPCPRQTEGPGCGWEGQHALPALGILTRQGVQ